MPAPVGSGADCAVPAASASAEAMPAAASSDATPKLKQFALVAVAVRGPCTPTVGEHSGMTKLPEIDALRGIAALVVAFLFHQHYLLGQPGFEPLRDVLPFAFLHVYGWVAVDLFFVISGFIFAHVYLSAGKIKCGAGAFARARFARLYPLHAATLAVAALVFAAGNPASVDYAHNDIPHFVLNLLMLQESGLNAGKSFNIPAWSISVETLCYAVFYFAASRFGPRLTAVAATIALAGLAMTLGDGETGDHIGRGLCGFFAGVVAYRLRHAPRDLLAGLGLAGAALIAVGSDLNPGAVLGATLFPVLVIAAPRIAVLRHAALQWLGDRSYSIYLIHAPLYMALNVYGFGMRAVPAEWTWPALIGAWLILLALADLSFRRFETPARRWLNAARMPQPAPA